MRVIVRLLPGLAILGAAAALVVLVGWAQDARADLPVPDPVGADAPGAPATPTVPPPPSPPAPPAVPSAPDPPPVTAPSPPATPTAPDLSPETTLPAPPGIADTPTVPAPPPPPDAPGFDLETVTSVLGPLPGVPSFTPPEQPELPVLPELPELPVSPLPEPAPPAPGPMETGVVPDARMAAANPPGLAPTEAALEPPSASGTGGAEDSDLFAVLDRSSAPARAPPVASPLHSCPGGAASNSGHAESAGLLPPGTDDATRRASLLFGARSCASNSVFDPLLRPD